MSLHPPAPPGRPGRPGAAYGPGADAGWGRDGYWLLVAVFAVVGIIGFATIGMGFLILAAAPVAASPFRANRPALWAIVGGTLAFLATVILFGVTSCTTTASGGTSPAGPVSQSGPTMCRNLVGMTFTGLNGSSPSLVPSLLAGLGVVAAVGVSVLLLSRRAAAGRPGETYLPHR